MGKPGDPRLDELFVVAPPAARALAGEPARALAVAASAHAWSFGRAAKAVAKASSSSSSARVDCVVLTYPVDEGVRRNGGRVGACAMPAALRRRLPAVGALQVRSVNSVVAYFLMIVVIIIVIIRALTIARRTPRQASTCARCDSRMAAMSSR